MINFAEIFIIIKHFMVMAGLISKVTKLSKLTSTILICAALTACDETTGKGQDVTQHVVAAWADAYFNYDFRRAQKYVTPESRKWLLFAATNVTQDDVDMLRAQDEGATVTVSNYEETDDSTALVTLHVQGSIICDTIGRPAHPSADATYTVTAVSRGGRMMVKMEGLPRSEKHSRD